jgi:hypothetical protein
MSVCEDRPTRCSFQLLQKQVLQAQVQGRARVLAPVEVEVVVGGVAAEVVQESALECAWEVREVVLVQELAVLC